MGRTCRHKLDAHRPRLCEAVHSAKKLFDEASAEIDALNPRFITDHRQYKKKGNRPHKKYRPGGSLVKRKRQLAWALAPPSGKREWAGESFPPMHLCAARPIRE